MRALAIVPKQPNSLSLIKADIPPESDGAILARSLQLGICGTDFEILSGEYGTAPEENANLIIGHESFGQVLEAPNNSGFATGDLIVGIVRRPDPEPCAACAAGEWDMCLNGRYTERGIKGRHGFGAELWRIEPAYAVRIEPDMRDVGVLVEPGTVLAKAWEHVEHIGKRAHWRPRTLLVTGAGPIGLLAALMGVQRGFSVCVLDQVQDGPKPALVEALGARYLKGRVSEMNPPPDVIMECSGAPAVMSDCMSNLAGNGILCMIGSSAHTHAETFPVSDFNRSLVLGNRVVFGVVNAAKRHYEASAEAIRKASRDWVRGLITRRETIDNWRSAFTRQANDVKVVIDWPEQP